MKQNIKILCCTFLFLLAACSDEGAEPTTALNDESLTAITILNISYGNDMAQTYDLYQPANRSSFTTKVLVFIHGGAWVQGDKADMRDYIPLLQQDNPDHAIVNINYRLAQPAIRAAFPNQFLDLQQALTHISEDAEELQIKPEFGLIGVSSGGHLALQYDNFYDEGDKVKMVCSIVGPTNFKDQYYSENPDFNLAMEFLVDKISYPGVTDYALAVSPAHFVDEDSSPTILFYGEDDDLVPITNGEFLQERLEAAGVDHSFTIYKGGHGDWQENENEDLQLQLSDFIKEHLPVEY